MDALEEVQGYLLLAQMASDKLYNDKNLNPEPDNPNTDIAELEAAILTAQDKLHNLQK